MLWTRDFTATAISSAVRAGTTTATEVVTEALARIAGRDPALQAFVVVRRHAALAEAAALDNRSDRHLLPLAGVPVAIKDNVAVAGEPLRIGSSATTAQPAANDHPVVARLRAGGAIVVGITAVPELCIWGSTDSPTAITRNPWNTDRAPGGSSGGSAAAVASGMVPIAHGADGMGSIRVPAASCGLFGIKPGHGIVPADLGPNSWFGVAENGPLATTVEDAALMLSVLADRPALSRIEPPRMLRIAVAVGSPVAFWRTDPHWIRTTRDIACVLADLGHTTAPCGLHYPVVAPTARWLAGPAVDAQGLNPRLLQRRTRTHVVIGGLALRAKLVDDGRVARAESRVRRQLDGFDAVLTPALAHPPPLATSRNTASWLINAYTDMHYAPYSAQWNVLRWPAASIPAGQHPNSGTPMAVQVVARPGQESLILSLAAQIQQHRPWARVCPVRDVDQPTPSAGDATRRNATRE